MPDTNGTGAAFAQYLRAGFSVIPVGHRSKRPAFSQLPVKPDGDPTFLPFTTARATPPQIVRWVQAGAYPGILAGEISAPPGCRLVPFDFDDREFCEWLLEHEQAVALLQRTWVVRSGSGLIHVYLIDESTRELRGQLKLRGRKIADVRTLGQYVVAPPSLHEDTGEPYATIFGSPEHVLRVKDAYALMSALAGLCGAPGPDEQVAVGPHPPVGPSVISPPTSPEGRKQLLSKLGHTRMHARMKRAIREGVIPGEGEWALEHDRSKISSTIVMALLEAEWPDDLIDLVFASLPIGELTYRNAQRGGSYGQAWLKHTLREKRAVFEGRKVAITKAKGTNWEVLSGACESWPDGRVWKLQVKGPMTGPKGDLLEIKEPDLKTYNGWSSAVLKYLGFYALMQPGHKGQDHFKFVEAVVATCEATRPPPMATTPGRLKLRIAGMAKNEVYQAVPQVRGQWTLGWLDKEHDSVYLLPSNLAERLALLGKPSDREVHEALQELGAVWVTARYGEHSEHAEGMWRLPLAELSPEQPHRNGTS